MRPLTVEFNADFWARPISLLGSCSLNSGKGPTEKIRVSVMPEAVRARSKCSPRRASGLIFSCAKTELVLFVEKRTSWMPGS